MSPLLQLIITHPGRDAFYSQLVPMPMHPSGWGSGTPTRFVVALTWANAFVVAGVIVERPFGRASKLGICPLDGHSGPGDVEIAEHAQAGEEQGGPHHDSAVAQHYDWAVAWGTTPG